MLLATLNFLILSIFETVLDRLEYSVWWLLVDRISVYVVMLLDIMLALAPDSHRLVGRLRLRLPLLGLRQRQQAPRRHTFRQRQQQTSIPPARAPPPQASLAVSEVSATHQSQTGGGSRARSPHATTSPLAVAHRPGKAPAFAMDVDFPPLAPHPPPQRRRASNQMTTPPSQVDPLPSQVDQPAAPLLLPPPPPPIAPRGFMDHAPPLWGFPRAESSLDSPVLVRVYVIRRTKKGMSLAGSRQSPMLSFHLPFAGSHDWTEQLCTEFVHDRTMRAIQSWAGCLPEFLMMQHFSQSVGAMQSLDTDACFCLPIVFSVEATYPLPRTMRGDKRTPQLVLLDHGLYKELSPTLRSDYAALWKALVFADVNEIKKQCVKLGAGEDLSILFAGMLTMRPWKRIIQQDINHLKIDGTEEDKEEIQMYASQLVSEISLLLQRLPREILLLLKTNDCLRAVDYCLGSSVNSFVIIARVSSRALADLKAHGIQSRLSARLDMLKVEIRLLILQLLEWMMLFRRSFKLQHSY
ncbi:hypothetical protein L7F22_010593 [Adiantum nelumboides]|nr:hypothetical protein [Adiantum nelumboides]